MRRFFRSFLRAPVIAGGILLGCIVISISIVYFKPQKASSVQDWHEGGYRFRQRIEVNNAGTEQTDFQIQVKVDTATLISSGKMQPDCDDVRFVSANGEDLPFFQATGCNATITRYWVKVNRVSAGASQIFMYYGNDLASSASNRDATLDVSQIGTYIQTHSNGSIASNHGASSDRENNFYISNSTIVNRFNTSWVYQQQFSSLDLYTGLCYDDQRNIFYGIDWNNKQWSAFNASFTEIAPMDQALGDQPIDCGTDSTYIYTNHRSGIIKRNAIADNSSDTINMDSLSGFDWGGQGMTYAFGYLFAGTTASYGANGNRIYVIDVSDWNNPQIVTYWDAAGYQLTEVAGLTWKDKSIYQTSRSEDYALEWQGPVKKAATEPVVSAPTAEEVSPNAAGYWKFDEGTSSTVNSSSGDVSGTISGATWQTEDQCVSGKCLYFDGTDDYVTMGNPVELQITGSQTISMWLKPMNFNARRNPLAKAYGGEGTITQETSGTLNYYYGISGSNGGSYQGFNSAGVIQLYEWNHIALVRDLSNMTLTWYINGQQTATTSANYSAAVSGSNTFYIGRGYVSNYAGFIDEVKVYPYARSDLQIKADYIAGATDKGSSVVLGAIDNAPLADGLIGYWKMDESVWNGTGGEVIDSSGVGNHGTRGGNATTTAGKFGKGGTFDGGGDYVLIPASGSLDQQNLTIVSWNNSSNYDANMFMFEKTTNGSVNTQYSLFYDTGGSSSRIIFRTVGLSPQDLIIANPSSGPVINQWNMIVATYDASERVKKIYVNGTLVASQTGITGTITTNPAGTSWIGTYGGGVGYAFNGRIDETRVYRRALSETEVQDLYQWAPGPEGFWNFDEGNGTSANDRSGNGNTGTLTNGPIWDAGKYGTAVQFDGNDDHVLLSSQLNMTDAFTFSAWFNKSNSSGVRTLVSSNVSGGPKIFFDTNDALGIRVVSTIAYINVGYTASMNGTWHYVAVTRDSSGAVKASLDGGPFVSAFTQTGTSTWQVIGSTPPDGGQRWAGNIDEVRFYNYARTQDQILQDMASSAVPGANSDPSPDPAVYFSLDEGYGTTANNTGLGGSTNNATISNGTWSNAGKQGKALSFNGTNTSGSFTHAPPTAWSDPFSISAWVYVPTGATWANAYKSTIIGRGSYAGSHGLIRQPADNLVSAYIRSDAGEITTSQYITRDTWWHLVMTWDGAGTLNLYANANPSSNSSTTTGVPDNTTWSMGGVIAYGGASGNYFSGSIDEVKIFNAALSADQVLLEYNAGTPAVMGAISTGSDGTSPDSSSSREYCVPGDTSTCNPPVLEMKFDENTGTSSVYDTSGNGLMGSMNGSMTSQDWVKGVKGSALEFDGVNDHISVPNNSVLNPSNITVSLWAKSNTATWNESGFLVSKRDAYIIHPQGGSTNVSFYIAAPSWVSTGCAVTDITKWHQYTMTWNGSTLTAYIDGARCSSVNIAGSINTSDTGVLTIGRDDGLVRYFNGAIDDVIIYNYARTPAQIAWEYNKGAPVAHYKFDECEGSTIYNSAVTGNREAVGNNGTLTIGGGGSNTSIGTCATSGAWADGASGKEGASMDFDGTDDYVGVSGNWLYSEQTVSFWAKDTWSSSSGMPISSLRWVSPDHDGFRFIGGTNQMTYSIYNNSQSEYTYNQPLSGSDWNHFVLTWTPTVTKAYLNGVLVNTTNRTNTFDANTTDMDIGRYNYLDNSYFSGQIDEVRIYNYALTDAQVRDVYNNGAVSFK